MGSAISSIIYLIIGLVLWYTGIVVTPGVQAGIINFLLVVLLWPVFLLLQLLALIF